MIELWCLEVVEILMSGIGIQGVVPSTIEVFGTKYYHSYCYSLEFLDRS